MTDEAKAMSDVERVAAELQSQMERRADDDTPTSICREKGLIWLEGWFDIPAAINAMSGWRYIETAPRDDTLVLLGGGEFFCEARSCWLMGPMVAGWLEGQWLIGAVESGYVGLSYNTPTHWMPLPTSPSTDK